MTGSCSYLNYLQSLAERLPRQITKDDTVEVVIESKGEARAAQSLFQPDSDLFQRFGFWAKAQQMPVTLLLQKVEAVKLLGASVQVLNKHGRAAILRGPTGNLQIGFKRRGA
jgi:hypothetical protein